MSFKREVVEWRDVMGSRGTSNNYLLPALKLSYDRLPPNMKQCFAFSAVFPQDHEMDKERYIDSDVAVKFISSNGSTRHSRN